MGNKNKKNRATEVLRRLVSTLRGAFRKVNLFFPNPPIINQCIVDSTRRMSIYSDIVFMIFII